MKKAEKIGIVIVVIIIIAAISLASIKGAKNPFTQKGWHNAYEQMKEE